MSRSTSTTSTLTCDKCGMRVTVGADRLHNFSVIVVMHEKTGGKKKYDACPECAAVALAGFPQDGGQGSAHDDCG